VAGWRRAGLLPTPIRSDLENAMRYEQSSFRVLALLAAVTVLGACGAKEETPMTEEAPAAAAAPPTPDSYTAMADDGSWSVDVAPAGIVLHRKGKADMNFEYKEPVVNGAISDYESLMMGQDTVRLALSLAMSKCTDKAGAEYTHIAQLFLTGDVTLTSKGCANKK
jgi:uncharacterized membrane protein